MSHKTDYRGSPTCTVSTSTISTSTNFIAIGIKLVLKVVSQERDSSTESEKLLGLHINSSFDWNSHIEKLVIALKKRLGLLKRIKKRVPKDKLIITAEAIFNSKISYGIAVYLKQKEVQQTTNYMYQKNLKGNY